jgi:hypothetical protein
MILIAPVMTPAAPAPAIARPTINSDVVCAAADSIDPTITVSIYLLKCARHLPMIVASAKMNSHFTLHKE